MLYGTVPFKAVSMEELHSLILKGQYVLKDDISQDARDMLRGLLEINPHKRISIPEI
jgi:serine/threonine protein kinase